MTRNRALGFALAALVLVADLLVKWWVTGPLGLGQDGDQLVLAPFFALTRTSNYGVSMGLLTASSDTSRWLLVALTAGIALVVLVWMLRERKLADIVPLAMILGGALGNIRDRVVYGHVIDYADFHLGSWRPFLVFNLADAAITLGVVFILARSFLSREKRDVDAAPAATEN